MSLSIRSLVPFAALAVAAFIPASTFAQPADAAKAPAPAASQVDENAKRILTESAEALKNADGLTFKTRHYITGGGLDGVMDANANVKLQRAAGKPAAYLVEGVIKQNKDANVKVNFLYDGVNVQWLDWEQNKMFQRPASDRLAQNQMNALKQLIVQPFTDAEPFAAELKMPRIERAGSENIGGEVCDLVLVSTSPGATQTWAISAIDRLPRKITKTAELPKGNLNMVFEVTELKAGSIPTKELTIAMPPNFTVDSGAPTAAAGNTPAVPVEEARLGLGSGAEVPSFAKKNVTGADFNQDSLKGKVSVVHFFNPIIKSSMTALSDMQALSAETQGTQFVAMSVKEASADAAKKALTDSKVTSVTLVPGGADLMDDFKVTGVPATYVIKPDGTVGAFFQGQMTRQQLLAAIETAGK